MPIWLERAILPSRHCSTTPLVRQVDQTSDHITPIAHQSHHTSVIPSYVGHYFQAHRHVRVTKVANICNFRKGYLEPLCRVALNEFQSSGGASNRYLTQRKPKSDFAKDTFTRSVLR